MSAHVSGRPFFYVDGAIPFDAPCYVERSADRALRELVARGELGYVLTASQMGKTSLIFRAQADLRAQDIPTAYIDLQRFGSGPDVSIEPWCRSFLNALAGQMALDVDVLDWWADHNGLTALDRLLTFLQNVVCRETGGAAAIFVDEIGTILGLEFGDAFLNGIRSLYQSLGAQEPRCRLAIVLIGMVAPDQLIRDRAAARFNVGVRVPLGELTLDDAAVLLDGLPGQDPAILRRVFHWTNGHPYLTQRLCLAIAQDHSHPWTEGDVDTQVKYLLLADEARELDSNLSYVRDALLLSPNRDELLRLYGAVCRGWRVRHHEQSPIQRELRFYGLVRPDPAGNLAVANPIYERVFNSRWVRNNSTWRWLRVVPRYAWVGAGLVLLLIVLLFTSLARARRSERVALSRRLFAESAAVLDSQYDLGLLLGVEAYRLSPTAETAAFLRSDLSANPYLAAFLRTHEAQVNVVAAAGDGARFASADDAGQIVLWDAADLSPRPLTPAAAAAINALAFSAGGDLLAAGGCAKATDPVTCIEGEVTLWDTAGGQRLAAWPAHDDLVVGVAFNADGRYLASIGATTLIVRSLPDGEPLWAYTMEEGHKLTSLAFHPTDPDRLVFGDGAGTLRLADLATGTVDLQFAAHADTLSALAFSDDGRRLASGGRDGSLAVWDAASWEPVVSSYAAHLGPVHDLAFDAAGRLFSTGGDGRIVQWAAGESTGRPAAELSLPDQGATGWSVAVADTPRGPTLLSIADEAIVVWALAGDAARGHRLWGHDGGALGLDFDPADGTTLASAGEDGTIRLWDTTLASPASPPAAPLAAHEGNVRRVVYQPGGALLASTGHDGRVLLWDMAADPPAAVELGRHETIARALTFSPDGARLASADEWGNLRIWDVATGALVFNIDKAHTGEIFDVAYSPDGRLLATGSWDDTVRFWDAATLAPLGDKLPVGLDEVWDIAFSPDGRLLAVAGVPETVALIDVAERVVSSPLLTGQTPRVNALAFTPDGTLLATAGKDATIAFWDMADRQGVGLPLDIHEASVYALAFSPDGRRLASADLNGLIFLTVMDHPQPAALACAIAGRNLTAVEKAQYVGPSAPDGAACP